MPMINEAIYALYEGVASVEAIRHGDEIGMNHPMGPLTLADFIGLDTCLAIMNVLYDGFGDSKYRPCPLLKPVRGGRLARQEIGARFLRLRGRANGVSGTRSSPVRGDDRHDASGRVRTQRRPARDR